MHLFTYATPPTVISDWSIFYKTIKLEAVRTDNRLVSYEAIFCGAVCRAAATPDMTALL